MIGTTDETFYTHYSSISTVEANWGLKNLGRNDINATVANVFSFVASTVGYTNVDVPEGSRPETNLTGIFPGPLNGNAYVPFTAPANQTAPGPGGKGVLLLPGLNKSFTPSVAPAPVNLTAQGKTVPASTPSGSNSSTPTSTSTSKSSADLVMDAGMGCIGAAVFAVISTCLLLV
jgi:hypothetical protein